MASAGNYTEPSSCAFDQQRKTLVFDDYEQSVGAGELGAVIPGNYTGTRRIIPLSTSNTIVEPGAVQVNVSNQVTVGDVVGFGSFSIYTYRRTGTALTLIATTTLDGDGKLRVQRG